MIDMYNQDLKSVREARKLTQKDLSDISGLPQSHIASIESGKFVPRDATRRRLAGVLGDVDWLATASGDKDYVTRKLIELINVEADNVLERIAHVRRILQTIEQNIKSIEK